MRRIVHLLITRGSSSMKRKAPANSYSNIVPFPKFNFPKFCFCFTQNIKFMESFFVLSCVFFSRLNIVFFYIFKCSSYKYLLSIKIILFPIPFRLGIRTITVNLWFDQMFRFGVVRIRWTSKIEYISRKFYNKMLPMQWKKSKMWTLY